MGEFWENIKEIWSVQYHGTHKDQIRADQVMLKGLHSYTGKTHLPQTIREKIKHLEKYECTVIIPRTSEVVKYEIELLKIQIKSASPSQKEEILEKFNDLEIEYESLLKAEQAHKQAQQNKEVETR